MNIAIAFFLGGYIIPAIHCAFLAWSALRRDFPDDDPLDCVIDALVNGLMWFMLPGEVQ